jgi:hypothetical protein
MPPENPAARAASSAAGEAPALLGLPDRYPSADSAAAPRGPAYTLIHGEWYDLTRFAHPGGPVALGLAYGRDATRPWPNLNHETATV